MTELMATPGVKIYDSGEDDGRYQRPLVWIRLADGRSIGGILIAERLAREWTPGYHGAWRPQGLAHISTRNELPSIVRWGDGKCRAFR